MLAWQLQTLDDAHEGGASSVSLFESEAFLHYEYTLSSQIAYPQIKQALVFSNNADEPLVNLSEYQRVRLQLSCVPDNDLTFFAYIFDERTSTDKNNLRDIYSYKIAYSPFSCSEEVSTATIELQQLTLARWWLERINLDSSGQHYELNKVMALAIVGSGRGITDAPAKVNIQKITLEKRNMFFIALLLFLSALIWISFAVWALRYYTGALLQLTEMKLRSNMPFVAYKKLSIDSGKDKQKKELLQFMASEYTNPDLSLEFAVNKLSLNRAKINEILKEELGVTFSVYLNMLRLSRAARMLSQDNDMGIADIALSTGYNSVSYFSKLFKEKYGYAPKKFRELSRLSSE